MSSDNFQRQARLLRALAHPVRLQLMEILSHQEACVCHLTAALHRPQPYISQQLSTLHDAGLVSDRRDGTLVYYSATDGRIISLLATGRELVLNLAAEPVTFSANAAVRLENCPCPRCCSE